MSQNKFTISYPALHAGIDKSEIEFIKGKPDLAALFFEGEEAKESRRRFFVTDATVASLECMQTFISRFDDGVCGKDNLLILGSGEPYKNIESVLNIVRAAFDANFSRKDISLELVVALSVISLPLPLQFINGELRFSLFLLPFSVW